MFGTVRWRLVAWNVLVLTIILVVLETLVYTAFTREVYSGVDAELTARAAHIEESIINGDPGAVLTEAISDQDFRVAVLSPDGTLETPQCIAYKAAYRSSLTIPPPPCPPSLLRPANADVMSAVRQSGEQDLRTMSIQGHPERVLTVMVRMGGFPFVVQVSRIAAGESQSMRNLRLLLLLGGIFGVLLSAIGSLFLANRALVPIRQAFSRQRQFTADASHELRTPLALIRANAEMLARHGDRLTNGDDELVNEIIQETDHLNRLVSDLLTLARADTDAVRIDSRPVDFRALVSEVHEDVQRIAESRGIESSLDLDGPITVSGDETRLRQLLLILLDNALKYTDPGGRVDLSLTREDNHAHLVVTDTGIGIPADDLPHIFDRFYRVDRAREHESGGTGLGLSIAKWIVQAHNGTIKAESTLGTGTRFDVDLPATRGVTPVDHPVHSRSAAS
jgi:two-component system sensor histidine kinase CiaH